MTKKNWLLIITLFAFLIYGCDISDSNNNSTVTEELTEEELEVAGQIIAESLSDQKDGIFASLNDAFSLPSSNNLTENTVQKGKYASPVFSAVMAENSSNTTNNYSYSYDPDTGTHLVNFSRNINEENFLKETTAELKYVYFDGGGNFIYSPRLDSDLIETIEYTGKRTGSIETPNKISSYERYDEFLINGLNSGGPLSIEGLHEGSGHFKVTRENGDVIERNYTLTVEFLDVQINSQTLSDGSLQKSVEGALAYEMMISKTQNGDESMKTVNGTIEFNGDGTALLRFQNILDDFKVTLEQGNLIADNEFEGFVESVDTESEPQQFTLFDGNTYLFGTDTEIYADGDLLTLADVKSTLEGGIRVQAEGTFAENTDGALILQTVKFEFEDDDLEFEGIVASANSNEGTDGGSFTLEGEDGETYNITEETTFDEEGDILSLDDLLWALDNEFTVEAEGEFLLGEDGSRDVTEVKFEFDDEEFEFDDNVASVDSENNSFTLENGDTYIIDESTTFHDRSDLNSFEELINAITEGTEVEAEGEYTPQFDGSRVATVVKFETDEEDDDSDNGDDEEENRDEIDFSGKVASADAENKTVTLQNGMVLQTNEETDFDENIQSLGNLVGALQRGDMVFVEGEFYKDSEDNNVALELDFDVERQNGIDEESDEERDEFEFEGEVSSADASSRTFQVNGVTFYTTNETEFDGDLNSLDNLIGALQRGDNVEAEGEYFTDTEGRNIVTEVEFEVERRDDEDDEDEGDDDGDDDGDEENEFGGRVNSVDTSSGSFELMNGRVYVLSEDVEFDDEGDLFSLQEVADDLSDGFVVTTEGIFEPQDDGTRLVISVKFESNRDDDDDDSDEDEDREELDFEGSVDSATESTFTIGDVTYTVNDDTDIEGDGITSMQDVVNALNNEDEVEAEGEYYVDGDDNIVIEVEFEVERRDEEEDEDDSGDGDDVDDNDNGDEDREELDFEGSVDSATESTFTIDDVTYTVNDDTDIEGDGIISMQDVVDALNNEDEVEAEGEYFVDGDNNIVIEVEFDIESQNIEGDEEDDNDEEDDDDDEEEEDDDDEEDEDEG